MNKNKSAGRRQEGRREKKSKKNASRKSLVVFRQYRNLSEMIVMDERKKGIS